MADMAKKRTTLEALASEMRKGFAKQGKEIGDLTASVQHIVKHMATKEDIADLRRELKGDILAVHTQVNSIERQLRETKMEVRLSDLEEKVFGGAGRASN
jgi:hypothetical protein